MNLMILYQTVHLPKTFIRMHRELWYICIFCLTRLKQKTIYFILGFTLGEIFFLNIPQFSDFTDTIQKVSAHLLIRSDTVPRWERYPLLPYSFQVFVMNALYPQYQYWKLVFFFQMYYIYGICFQKFFTSQKKKVAICISSACLFSFSKTTKVRIKELDVSVWPKLIPPSSHFSLSVQHENGHHAQDTCCLRHLGVFFL